MERARTDLCLTAGLFGPLILGCSALLFRAVQAPESWMAIASLLALDALLVGLTVRLCLTFVRDLLAAGAEPGCEDVGQEF